MARPKNPRNAFLGALDEAPQPIYLLDSEQTKPSNAIGNAREAFSR